MYASRFVILIIGLLFFQRELLIIQEHEHENIRLFDHIVAIQTVIGPVRVQGKVCNRDAVNIDMRHIEESVMLFIDPTILILRDAHMFGQMPPLFTFFLFKLQALSQSAELIPSLTLHLFNRFQRVLKHFFRHQINIGIVIDHQLEFIWPHDAIISVLACLLSPLPTGSVESRNLNQHFNTLVIEKGFVPYDFDIMPQPISYSSTYMKLKIGMLP
ncbi:hypothetical protein D3C71_1220550 [compost metagenome]